MKKHTLINGLGFHVPDNVVTNADLEKSVDTTDEWITTRTGIKTRHIVEDDECLSDLALEASRKALRAANMEAEELTHILVATFSADAYIPSGACVLQHKLGLSGKMAMDVAAACSGFLYALETARALLLLHQDAKILVVAADIVSSRTNWEDRATCVLFGDGAGAAILTAGDEKPEGGAIVRDILLASDGSIGDLLTVRGGGSGTPYKLGDTVREDFFVQMKGRDVYKHAVRNMTNISKQIMEKHGMGIADIDVLMPHQANIRIIEAVGERLKIDHDKVFINVDKYGNTSAGSVPIGLTEALETGVIAPGMRVLLTTFGGGFTWGSALVEF